MPNTPPYIIAELANAHGGNFNDLMGMVDAAIASKADAVKFQWFSPDTLALPDFEWYPVYQELMFSEDEWDRAIARCVKARIDIWVDATDASALARIKRHEKDIHGIKVAATAFLDKEHVNAVLGFNKPTLLGIGGHEDATIVKYTQLYRQINSQLIVQHGVQAYPTKKEDATLARIHHLGTLLQLHTILCRSRRW